MERPSKGYVGEKRLGTADLNHWLDMFETYRIIIKCFKFKTMHMDISNFNVKESIFEKVANETI